MNSKRGSQARKQQRIIDHMRGVGGLGCARGDSPETLFDKQIAGRVAS